MQAQTLFHQDLFHSFEAMKTAAPGILARSEEPGFFDGVFLGQDSEVSTFVEDVRGAVKTAEKTEAVTESLKKMQDQLNCSDDMLELWVDDVKQWASKDRNKRRQKIAQEKKRLLEDIHKYNQQRDGDPIDINTVVEKLSNKSAESVFWPWQELNRGYPNGITEEGYNGLMCPLRRNLDDLRLKQQTVAGAYRGPRLVEEEEDMEEEKDWQSDNSSDDEDDAEEGT
ncbi:hypothetical protein NQZ68_026291 [Dissostichus eleginoides]|nr:hypothetical protein NQZ68_026291 [Dissostichus eleginoides]